MFPLVIVLMTRFPLILIMRKDSLCVLCSVDKDVRLEDADHVRVGASSLSGDPARSNRWRYGRFLAHGVGFSIPCSPVLLGPDSLPDLA